MRMWICLVLTMAAVAVAPGCASREQAEEAAGDPLPSWNEGETKRTILDFVRGVTDPESPDFVEPSARIATFDHDGTLWAEKPIYVQIAFVLDRLDSMAVEHPGWHTEEPFRAALDRDFEALEHLDEQSFLTLVFFTHSGTSPSEFEGLARSFLANSRHPQFGRPYTELVYQPMLELLDHLRINDFRVFIVTGGGVDFVRAFSEDVYGIPQEDVVGSSAEYVYTDFAGRGEVLRQPRLASLNDEAMKPANIALHIGRRPTLAFGNSDGDVQMLRYTADGDGPRLALLLRHDDAEREFSYDKRAETALQTAQERGWTVVSIRKDFATVFPGTRSD
jgi:phosphoserine phosphatase